MSDVNGFSNKEMLIGLDKKVDDGFREMKELIANGQANHERRLIILESFKSRVLGAVALIVFLTPAIVTLSVYHKL